MKRFLAVLLGSPTSPARAAWDKIDEKTRKEREAAGIRAWGDWMMTHQASILERGGPLGKTKRIGKEGISDARNDLCGYVALQAESAEAAAKLFLNHPHFAMFPGEAVEVVEILPIPGMP